MIDPLQDPPFQSLLEQVGEAVWLRKPTGRMVYVNQALVEAVGVPREDLLGDPRAYFRHIAPEDRPAVMAAGRGAAIESVTVEFEVRVPGDRPRRLRASLGPLHQGDGEVMAIVGMARDVTSEAGVAEWRERVLRAEDQRDAAEAGLNALRMVLDRITDAFLALDEDWRLLFVNRRCEELLGVEREAAIGAGLLELFPEAEGTVFHRRYERAFRENRTERFEGYYEPLAAWFEVTAYPSPEGLSIFFQDITAKRRLEVELVEAVSRERQRLGAELHDSVGQKLTGAALLVRALEARVASGEAIPAEELAAVGAVLQGTVSETRRISRGLFPAELNGENLPVALRSLAAEVEELFAVTCRVDAARGVSLPSDVELHLLRITQELITNALKHGGATTLSVELGSTERGIELTVEHDGASALQSESENGGLGRRSIQYRAQAIGASLETDPSGRRTLCRVPA